MFLLLLAICIFTPNAFAESKTQQHQVSTTKPADYLNSLLKNEWKKLIPGKTTKKESLLLLGEPSLKEDGKKSSALHYKFNTTIYKLSLYFEKDVLNYFAVDFSDENISLLKTPLESDVLLSKKSPTKFSHETGRYEQMTVPNSNWLIKYNVHQKTLRAAIKTSKGAKKQ